jgi:hypothetical protein
MAFRISSGSLETAVAGAGFPVTMMATDSANKDFPLRCAGALYPMIGHAPSVRR